LTPLSLRFNTLTSALSGTWGLALCASGDVLRCLRCFRSRPVQPRKLSGLGAQTESGSVEKPGRARRRIASAVRRDMSIAKCISHCPSSVGATPKGCMPLLRSLELFIGASPINVSRLTALPRFSTSFSTEPLKVYVPKVRRAALSKTSAFQFCYQINCR